MSECQEEFEKWTLRVNGKWGEKVLEKGPEGRYQILQTWNDWIAWQGAWEVRNQVQGELEATTELLGEAIVSRNRWKALAVDAHAALLANQFHIQGVVKFDSWTGTEKIIAKIEAGMDEKW